MTGDFEPAWWCRNPHGQTLWARVIRRAPEVPLIRERLELPDGDYLDIDCTTNEQGPIVIILHGLEGSSASPYARGMLNAITLRGWRGVVMHFRGCSGEPNRLARSYHSGDTGDFAYLLNTLRKRDSLTPLAAIGFSLGGNVLLKWLGTTEKQASLRAAVAISVPYQLSVAADRLQKGFSRLYQWHLMRSLRNTVSAKRRHMNLPIALQDLSTLRTLRDFDDNITAPLHGFNNADHYYSVASSRQYLGKIAVPTLLLHARDDPFMTESAIPRADEFSDAVTLELSTHGGHVGFVTGTWPWRVHYWLEERIPTYLAQYL